MEEVHDHPENVEFRSGKDEVEDNSSDSSVDDDKYQKPKRYKTTWGRICSGAHTLAWNRAKELQTKLAREHPCFIKQMQWSHVVEEFVLDVPAEFCRLHFPLLNVEVTLEDESGKGYIVKLLPGTEGQGEFELGWKRFSVAHKLLESDVVVFQLLKPCYFKVYIIRADDPAVVGSTNLKSFTVHANEGMKERKCEDADRKGRSLAPDTDIVQEGVKRSSLPSNPNLEPGPDHPRPSAEEFHLSDMEISKLSERAAETVQQSVKRSSLLSNPNLDPGPDHLSTKEFHSSDMEISILSERAADFEGHKHPENVKVQAGEEKEGSSDSRKVKTGEAQYSSGSSCMVILKPPSLKSNIPSFSKKVSSLSRKKTHQQVAHDNNQTSKRCTTKMRRIDSEAHALALERAEELQTNLPSENPSFIKKMQPSNLSQKSALVVPLEFCKVHLPMHDAQVTLEDESGESYKVEFHPREKKRFIGGWNRFSAAHKLLEGDVIVFQLLRPCYFKVYILRANDPAVVGSIDLSSSNVHAKEGEKKRKSCAADREARPVDTVPESVERRPVLSNPSLEPGRDRSSTEDFLRPSDIEASPLSGRDADFEKFKIIVNGEVIDEELPRSTRLKYYKLCCSRESYLHKHLLKNVDRKLVAGIITGTLKAADAIRACKPGTSKEDIAMWDNSLEGFKRLGMDVGFLRERLERLASLGSELRGKGEVQKYLEAKNKRARMREEMRGYEMKLLELKHAEEEVEDEMKSMKVNILKHKDDFQQEASAPW